MAKLLAGVQHGGADDVQCADVAALDIKEERSLLV